MEGFFFKPEWRVVLLEVVDQINVGPLAVDDQWDDLVISWETQIILIARNEIGNQP